MRLLVTGATGQIGWELRRSLMPLGQVIALDRNSFDLSRPHELSRLIRDMKPHVAVNAAAYTSVDQAETDEQLATVVNSTAVGVLAEETRRIGALFIQYSTDYVFDGAKSSAYVEEDPPNPINAYGRSKLAGEFAIRDAGGDYLILRTSWVYAARGRNFLRTIMRLARDRDELRVVADQLGAPTWARNISDATAQVVQHARAERQDGRFVSAILHMTACGATSWHGFAQAIVEAPGSSPMRCGLSSIRAIASEEYPLAARRPKNSLLCGTKLYKRFGLRFPDWKGALALCMEEAASADST
jgi:dTDP-4-dehydrorhamnose reductase